ncbi:MAG: tRNA (adenosine(37)-N6)-threonylcarbamoyltransferase complex dimerization subunit type 1 TsaB [Deltaproteobacteria bacterium]|jgi:tRNA threonylcarbamoyladenosine biosynthesis protein TsaB|nr:tRNA (adenosine(37)-N6)-threonylcarbamoyltransferase complex dimerization subunit type 1 TsaB [Deltaproteobacteria bacterium]MBW2505412.1 tRNA (adenosine(37)-N6)-threonylcarbamoyltransferase complex dimerization subunit type 1 TsaB [Deltaproteobacteria bacterium]MBW2520788.1 tRNA (adenosine(37)-N6)-threonylcarbamoyltransferase complex dimerization subunit type 1 TsaB [Deltaproteobacteria bacterium]
MTVRLLTVQTATPAGSVALTDGERVLGEISFNVRRTHNDWLLVAITRLLEMAEMSIADLDGFAVVVGPGSFTGLRVGIATVKALAQSCDRKIVGVSSLRTLAMQTPYSRLPVCSMLDARKKEVYTGLYSWESGQPEPLSEERVIKPEILLSELSGGIVFVGDGALTYRTLIVRQLGAHAHFAPWSVAAPRAASAALLALDDWNAGHRLSPETLLPIYIRPSEAELNWRR